MNGEFGVTPQYWLQYVDLVDSLRGLHYSLQVNNWEDRLYYWRKMLPYFFFFDRVHYSRYGSYYLKYMENIDVTHPGAQEELKGIGISVGRNNFGIGQAIDLAGEQTYTRNAKTIGGNTSFQTRKAAVYRWVRGRASQTKFVDALKEMTGVQETSYNPKKSLRPSEIIKSDKIVENIMDAMQNHFIEPFDPVLEKVKLYNLMPGKPVPDNVKESLCSVTMLGEKYVRNFELRLEESNDKAFHDTLTRNKHVTFKAAKLKLTLKKSGKNEEVRIQKGVLGTLLAKSNIVDISGSLAYPFFEKSPTLCTADCANRKTQKSSLTPILEEDLELADSQEAYSSCNVNMQDLAAYVRTVVTHCKTIRDIGFQLVKSIPNECKKVYVMVDSYSYEG